jgi:hypothetical protein
LLSISTEMRPGRFNPLSVALICGSRSSRRNTASSRGIDSRYLKRNKPLQHRILQAVQSSDPVPLCRVPELLQRDTEKITSNNDEGHHDA